MTLPVDVICALTMPNQDHLADHILENRQYCDGIKDMVHPNSMAGKTVNICGAGPSLADFHDELLHRPAHQTWGCNSAVPYLKDHGLPVDHGFCVDQGTEMLNPAEWARTWPDVTYFLSSSVHPDLTRHLRKANRRIRWFHNYLGIQDPEGWKPTKPWQKPTPESGYEMYLYCTEWPSGAMTGYGLNSVPRAVGLAAWMGFSTIRVYGADCAAKPTPYLKDQMPNQADGAYTQWLDTVQLYASGRTPRDAYGDNAVMVEAIVCDDDACDCKTGHPPTANVRFWHTRADMVISALHLVDIERMVPSVQLMGDTLPNAIKRKPQAFFDALPKLTGKGSISGFGLMSPLAKAEEVSHD